MSDPRSELSSLGSALESLVQQLRDIAEQCSDEGRNDLAHELFEVERALSAGTRRLVRAVNKGNLS